MSQLMCCVHQQEILSMDDGGGFTLFALCSNSSLSLTHAHIQLHFGSNKRLDKIYSKT